MLQRIKLFLNTSVPMTILMVTNTAFAANKFDATGTNQFYTGSLESVINTILSSILGFAALISVIYIVYGGFMYLTSAGNKDNIGKAKTTLIYAIIGLLVIALAFAIKKWAFVTLGLTDPQAQF